MLPITRIAITITIYPSWAVLQNPLSSPPNYWLVDQTSWIVMDYVSFFCGQSPVLASQIPISNNYHELYSVYIYISNNPKLWRSTLQNLVVTYIITYIYIIIYICIYIYVCIYIYRYMYTVYFPIFQHHRAHPGHSISWASTRLCPPARHHARRAGAASCWRFRSAGLANPPGHHGFEVSST